MLFRDAMTLVRITATEIGDGVQKRKEVAMPLLNKCEGNSMTVQWLGIHTLTARAQDWIPGRETKIL